MKKWIGGVLALAVIAGGTALYMQRGAIAFAVFERGAVQVLATPTIDALGDGLHAGFCGTGSPLADRRRAGPCLAIVAGERLFVFDAGEGAAESLALMGLPAARIEAVFLTHFHSDHIDGLAALALQRWASSSADAPLGLHGAPGAERIANGLNEAYAIDSTYRVAHHGTDIVPPGGFGLTAHPFAMPPPDESTVVYDQDGVRVLAFAVDHSPVDSAVGYRIEYEGRSVVISGDTKRCACVVRAAANADLLVHEALSQPLTRVLGSAAQRNNQPNVARIFQDIENYHTTPREAAEVAASANVRALALTHIVPPMPIAFLEGVFVGDARDAFEGPLWVMRDGDIVTIAPDGDITRRNTIRF
ncbi:MAG: MBL fold metallo-hydrolase [Hyphomonadaceae bacterium]|nr:MBL fold metallo-hydrolase [Hyphomonadaceae bacterium]